MFLWPMPDFPNFYCILLTTIWPTNGEKYRKVKKISLENCKIWNFSYSLAGRFLKQFSSANLNNFQGINLLKLYTLLTMTPRHLVKKLGKSDVGFLREGCMGSKKITSSYLRPRGTEFTESIQADNRSEVGDKIYWQATQRLCSHFMQQPSSQWQYRIIGFGCENNSKCMVISSHGQVVTQSTRHNAIIHDGQLVTRF